MLLFRVGAKERVHGRPCQLSINVHGRLSDDGQAASRAHEIFGAMVSEVTPPCLRHRSGKLVRWLLERVAHFRGIRQTDLRFPVNSGYSSSGRAEKWLADSSDNMAAVPRIRLVGINHVELDVGNVEAALFFYGRIFDLRLRARGSDAAFIDLGDQFLVFRKARGGFSQKAGHFGLVVEDRQSAIALARVAGAIVLMDPFPGFLDPWGNRVEIVEYCQVLFSKAPIFQQRMELNLSKAMTRSVAEELP